MAVLETIGNVIRFLLIGFVIILIAAVVFGIPYEGYCDGRNKRKAEEKYEEIEKQLHSEKLNSEEYRKLLLEQQLILKKLRMCGSPYPGSLEAYRAFFSRLGYKK
jgi:hypothetical protein